MTGMIGRAALLILAALVAAGAQAADRAALRDRCWSPTLLTGAAAEKTIRKSVRTFDAAPAAMTLAPYAPVPPEWRGAIRRVKLPAGKKLIALTFDLCELTGEVAGYDAELIDTLRTNGAKATFFAGGKWMRSHQERTRQIMADPLFELANHAEAHRNLRLLSGNALKEEIEGPQRAYENERAAFGNTQCVRGDDGFQSIPERMGLFRFPFGACNKAALDAVNDAGLLAIQWDISTGDPVPAQSSEAIAAAILRAKPGSILIGHANGRGFHTAEALKVALPKLKAKGFEFVTVTELLAQGTPEISATCYSTRPGDTDKYDQFFVPRAREKAKDAKPAETTHEPTAPSR
ncbi:MAG: polysaccharide deacetylase family protein [Hyphomicrobium sp.]|jgi:peptidoglycan/xylan/chitin deacetylase (PgdA/CDA1 family)|nr:polysaccharide deacetylase family protein [Hyphomicrobium sp.]